MFFVIGLSQGSAWTVHLSAKTVELKNRVERLYQQPIAGARLSGLGTGRSSVEPDGVPIIALSPSGQKEEVIVHELLHLLLRASGYPQYEIVGDKPGQLIGELLTMKIAEDIDEWVFSPEADRLGMGHDTGREGYVRQLLADPKSLNRDFTRVVIYFDAALFVKDRDLKTRFAALYQKNGWATAAETGKMADHVSQKNADHRQCNRILHLV